MRKLISGVSVSKCEICGMVIVILVCLGFSTSLFGAETTVKKINKDKHTVVINGLETEGFAVGVKVCFYNPKTLKRVACGKVEKNGKVSSLVSVSEKAIKKIKKKHTVSTFTDKVLSLSTETTSTENATVFNRAKRHFSVGFLYSVAIMNTSTMKGLGFVGLTTSTTDGSLQSLWKEEEEGTVGVAPVILGGTVSYHISELFSATLGFNYSFIQPTQILTTHEQNTRAYVLTDQDISSFEVYLDFTAYRKYFGVTGNNLAAKVGAIYENFSASVIANRGEGDDRDVSSEQALFESNVSLSMIGLRLGPEFEMAVNKMISVNVQAMFTVPVAGSPTYETKVSNLMEDHQHYLAGGKSVVDDINEAIDAKTSFGVDLSLGISMSF